MIVQSNTDSPKASIIVCCYNVAKYLYEGRLNDIYNQTYTNWELILIDDGSTDETSDLLDKEAQKDSRIVVHHKANGGLGSARNAGLDMATGDYIWAFDVDDHVALDTVEYCVSELEARKVDVLMFGFRIIIPSTGKTEDIHLEETLISNSNELRNAYLDKILFIPNGNGYFCNKFYRRTFLEKYNLRFENQRIQQDELFNLKVYEYLERCYISPRILYFYYLYNTGNNRSRFIPDRFQIYKTIYQRFRYLQDFWHLTDAKFDDYLYKRFYSNIEDCLTFNLFHPKCPWNYNEKQKQIELILEDNDVIDTIKYCKKHFDIERYVRYISYISRKQIIIKYVYYFFQKARIILHRFIKKEITLSGKR